MVAERALSHLGEQRYPSEVALTALEAKMVALAAMRSYESCLDTATHLEGATRRANNIFCLGPALDHIVFALGGLKRHEEAVRRATSALDELVALSEPDWANELNILSNAARALRNLARLGEVEAIGSKLLQCYVERADSVQTAKLVGTLLPLALEIGAFPWAVQLARQRLAPSNFDHSLGHDPVEESVHLLAAITAAHAWPELAAQVTDTVWQAAANKFAGWDISRALMRLAEDSGEAVAFAAFNGLLLALTAKFEEAEIAPSPAGRVLGQVLSDSRLTKWPTGLLTDVADAVTARLPGQFDGEVHLLRELAMFAASGRNPAMLARLDPDVAQMLISLDPTLRQAEPSPMVHGDTRRIRKGRWSVGRW